MDGASRGEDAVGELYRKAATELLTDLRRAGDREALRARIAQDAVAAGCVDGLDFKRVRTSLLPLLYEAYDELFFRQLTRPLLAARRGSLSFRLSSRMTKTGGKTTRLEYRRPDARGRAASFEITISTTLLFQGFRDPSKPEIVSGVRCLHRLDALQRIFEHEMIHLYEMLVWRDSSCSATRFQGIAQRKFGHTESTHRLPTAAELARQRQGIRPGTRVRFRHEGLEWQGFVNRIQRRATVLVEHPKGVLHDDGRRYRKFYVPLQLLERVRER